jgi:hypothetical protein
MTRAKIVTLGLGMWVAALVALGGCHKTPPAPPPEAATPPATATAVAKVSTEPKQALPQPTATTTVAEEPPTTIPEAAPPASAVAAVASVFNPGREGEGAATELETNRPAILHCDGREVPLPATLWFDQATVPEGESPFTFRSQPNGVYVVSFAGTTACTFTDREGRPLLPVDIQYQVVMGADGPTKTVLKLSLVAESSKK